MAQEHVPKLRGLITDPNPLSTAPDGACTEALNVWFPRDGMVVPRPSYRGNVNTITSTDEYAAQLATYQDQVFVWRTTANGSSEAIYRAASIDSNATTEIQTEGSASIGFYKPYYGHEVYKGNLYICTDTGIRRVRGTETTAYPAGMPRPSIGRVTAEAAGNAVGNNEVVRYRITYQQEVGDQTLESPPSPPFFYRNTIGATEDPTIRHYLNGEVAAGWKVGLYRSKTIADGSTPSDELFLVDDYVVTSTDVSNGYVEITDGTVNANLGRSLYTNETQQGIINAKYAPPVAKVIKEFNGMMFYGNIAANGTVETTDFFSLFVDSNSNWSATLTVSDPDVTGLNIGGTGDDNYVGWYISDNASTKPTSVGTNVDALTTWTTIDDASNTGTMSNAALAGGAVSGAVHWADLVVDSTRYFFNNVYSGAEDTTNRIVEGGTTVSPDYTSGYSGSASDEIEAWSLAYLMSIHNPDVLVETDLLEIGRLVINRASLTQARPGQSNTISGHTLDKTQDADNPTTPPSFDGDSFPGRLYISLPDEPEAVPLLNFIDIGDVEQPIYAIARTRDSLFIFKADGTWRLTGTDFSSIVLTEFDRNLRSINPRCVAESSSYIYVFTNRGVVRVSESGVVQLSEPFIANTLDKYLEFNTVTKEAHFLSVAERQEIVMVGTTSKAVASSSRYVDYLWVYSTKTAQWSRWDFSFLNITTAGGDPDTGVILVGGELVSTGEARFAYMNTDDTLGTADVACWEDSFTFTINTVTETSDGIYNIAYSGTDPSVGDVFFRGTTNKYTVSSVNASANTLVAKRTDDGGLDPTTGSTTVYQPFSCVVQPLIRSAKNPGVIKHWQEFSPEFLSLRGVVGMDVSFDSSINSASDTLNVSVPYTDQTDADPTHRIVRTFVHRDHRRAAELRPKLTINAADGRWAMASLSFIYRPYGTRVGL